MQYKLLILLIVLLSACTIPVYVTPTPTPNPTPTDPIVDNPTPDPNSGGSNPPVVTPAPNFSDPADLLIEADFDLVASPDGKGDCLTLQTACSLEKAGQILKQGQTLMLRGGLYPAGTTINLGQTTLTTVITAYPNEVPLIDGSYKPDVPGLHIIGDSVMVSNLQFRYNWTGLLLEGKSANLINLNAYANRVEGIYVKGVRPLLNQVSASHNSVGIKVEASLPVIRYSDVRYNQQGLLVNGVDPILEYNNAIENTQGITSSSGILRHNVAKENGAGILTVAGSLVYNNTIIGGEQSFVSATAFGQEASTYFFNLIYDVTVPELLYDTNLSNSWNLNIADPLFISIDENSPLFARINFNSPALNVTLPEGVPVNNTTNYLGAWGTP